MRLRYDGSDEDAVTYEVFKAMMKNKRDGNLRMDDKSYAALSAEGKALWRSLSKVDKATFLGASSSGRSVNVTDITGGDEADEQEEDTGNQERDVNETKVDASKAKSSAHPGDRRQMLSQSANGGAGKSKASDSASRSVNHVRFDINRTDRTSTSPHDAHATFTGARYPVSTTSSPQDAPSTRDNYSPEAIQALRQAGASRTVDVAQAYMQGEPEYDVNHHSGNPQLEYCTDSDDDDDQINVNFPVYAPNWDDSSSDEDFI